MVAVQTVLKDIKSNDWQQRIASLQKIKIIFKSVSLIFGEEKVQAISFLQRLLQNEIIIQLTDLRSSVAKEACEVIKWMAVEFPREFSQVGNPKQ